VLPCHVMLRTGVFQIRIEPELHERLARLRDERHVNVSAWARNLIAAGLDREFPAVPDEPRHPLPGWKPCKLEDGWGAVLDGPDVAKLAEDPRGTPIRFEYLASASSKASGLMASFVGGRVETDVTGEFVLTNLRHSETLLLWAEQGNNTTNVATIDLAPTGTQEVVLRF